MNYEGLTDRELWQLLFQKTENEMAGYMNRLDQLSRDELIQAADEISAMMTCHSELMAFGENLSRKKMIFLLQQEKLITLKDPDNLQATPVDIAKNPHNLKFVEVEAAAVARQLQDVDFAVINGNYAIEAGMHVKDALAVEDKNGKAVKQYANYIVTTPDKKDDARIKALVKVLTSDDFKKYLAKTYDKDVLPAF